MSRQAINASGAATVGPYSHAVDAGDLIFLSGQTPIDPLHRIARCGTYCPANGKLLDARV